LFEFNRSSNKRRAKYYELPEPSEMMSRLLNLAGVKLPERFQNKKANVNSRVKLTIKA
jgi:hypothetical protein